MVDPIHDKLLKIREKEDFHLKPVPRLRTTIIKQDGTEVPLQMRSYQAQMVAHMLMRTRFVCGDDVGLGKTLEAIATMAYIWAKEPDIIPIIVTTKSAILQWGGEIEKFSEGVSWVAVDGSQEKREKIYQAFFDNWDPKNPVALITNYHRLVRDHRVLEKHLTDRKFMIFMDEATAFKNLKSQTHKICKKFAHMATRAYGLTATLIKNNLEEGFGIFQVLCPGVFSSHNAFLNNYCVTRLQPLPGTKRKIKMLVGHSKDHVALFKSKIEPYYLGRAKHDVAKELPILTIREIKIPVSQSQWEYYHEALSGLLTLNLGTENEEERETTKLTQLIYCQQIVDDPYLIGNEGKSEKLNTLLELLDSELAGKKIIVFSRFKGMVDRIQDTLVGMGYTYAVDKVASRVYEPKRGIKLGFARITGDESSEERAAGRVAFMETEDTNIMFLTMAGAEAVNLQEAEVMVFFDLPWSAGDFIQLIGRMIRIGSPHQSVYAIHLIATGPQGQSTIDSHVTTTLNKKMGFIEGALGERLLSQGMPTSTSSTQDIFDMVFADARNIFAKGK